jgi:hypothetical protein
MADVIRELTVRITRWHLWMAVAILAAAGVVVANDGTPAPK